MLVYAVLAGAMLAAILMLLKWSLKTLLPRPAGLAVDRAFAAGGAVVSKIAALTVIVLLAGLALIMFVPPPH